MINKAESLGINLKNTSTPKRKAVSKCFNGIGISVPIDEVNDVGYRSLTMTNSELHVCAYNAHHSTCNRLMYCVGCDLRFSCLVMIVFGLV